MAKIDITKTELVWPGKYDDNGKLKKSELLKVPFQVIETVNETRASRDARKHGLQRTLFDTWEGKEGTTFETGWKNKLIWGDNKYVMAALLEKFAGKIDLIYIDPPFATGSDFSVTTYVGENKLEVNKERSIIEEKAYRDTWGKDIESYLGMMANRFALIRELLSNHGSLYVHLDPTVVHYIKIILDELFGRSYKGSQRPGFRNEIIWCYSGGGTPEKEYPRKHDVILWYSAGTEWTFNTQYRPYSEGTVQRGRTAVKGENAKLREEGTPVNDWWTDVKKIY